jgi:hypothetical protein
MVKIFWTFLLALSLTACATETATPLATPTPPPQPGAADLAATMIYQQIAIEATKSAANQQAELRNAMWTATAQAGERATMAAQAAATATERAIMATATERIRAEGATATQQAFYLHVTQTQQSWQATAQVQAAHDTATAIAAPMYATAERAQLDAKVALATAQVAEADLAVRRQQMKNGLDAFGPWAIIFLALAVAGLWVYFSSRLRTIERGAHGLLPGVVLQTKGGTVAADLENLAATGYRFRPDGSVDTLTSDADVVRRKQAVQAIGNLPPSKPPKLEVGQMFSVGSGGRVTVVSATSHDKALDDYEAQLAEEV